MLSQVQQAESGERERKRRPKALSCYDCRRRKLRCDPEYPSCGRCSKAGLSSTCRYETGPLESRNGQEESISDEDDGPPRARLHAPSDIQGGGISIHKPLIDDAPLASSQNRRIAQLETRVAKMETLASQASSVLSNLHPMSPESML